jgi:hypothetical protein
MSIRGKVENDNIKLPDGVHLPDGTEVDIELAKQPAAEFKIKPTDTFGARMSKYFGIITEGPGDLAENHDHYLYGTSKKGRWK